MKKRIAKTTIALLAATAMVTSTMEVPAVTKPVQVAQAATKKKVAVTNVAYGTLTIKKGSTFRLKAKAGSSKNQKFVWSSSKKKTVSVSKTGVIKGLKKGTATITVKAKKGNYQKAQIKVTVGTKVSKVKVIRPAMVLCVGNSITLKPEIQPQSASNKTIKYSSGNSKVAKVNSKGVVSGVKAGTTKITLKAADGSGKKTTVTVKVTNNVGEYQLVDDFYQSVNSHLFENATPEQREQGWDMIEVLADEIDDKVSNVITETANTSQTASKEAEKVSDLYQTIMDTDTRNKNGLQTIQGYLDEIEKVSTVDEYMKLVGSWNKEGLTGVIGTVVTQDLMGAKKNRLYFDELYTGLFEAEGTDAETEKAYTEYVQKLLEATGESKEIAEEHTNKVIAFQKEMAKSKVKIVNSYDLAKVYNPYSVSQLEKMLPNCKVEEYIQASGYENVDLVVTINPTQLKNFDKYLTEDNLELLKEYEKLLVMEQYAPYLTTEIYDAYQDVYAQAYEEEPETLEEFSEETSEAFFPWEVCKLYVEKYVNANTKADITNMTNKIIEQYKEEINQCTWFSASTKRKAISKVDKIKKNISYPDDFSSYMSESKIKGKDEGGILSENIKTLYAEEEAKERELLQKPYEEDEWSYSPLTVNAWYMVTDNSITIPIGISGGVFYDANRSAAENYGALGMVIGHEISHAFDQTGSMYDGDGDYNNWWSDTDRKKYQEILDKLEKYYDTFEVLPGVFQDGKVTLSENIADIAGVGCTVKLVGKDKDSRKKYFESYANVWAGEMTEKQIKETLEMDVHSLGKVRVNAVLPLIDEFYETYDIKSTDAMYVAPADRIRIW